MEIVATGIDTPDSYTWVNSASWRTATSSYVGTWNIPRMNPGRYRISWTNPFNFSGGGFGVALQEVAAWDPSGLDASISVSPMTIVSTGNATVSWNTTNASSATITGPGVSSTLLVGSQQVSFLPVGRHKYTLLATGFGGSTKTVTATLEVGPRDLRPTWVDFVPAVSVSPKMQTVASSIAASLSLAASNQTSTTLVGTDGTNISNPPSILMVGSRAPARHTYVYSAVGFTRIRWSLVEATQIILNPPDGVPIDATSLRQYDATQSGTWTAHFIAAGVSSDYTFDLSIPTATDTATVTFTSGPAARTITFADGGMTYGEVYPLASSTNGDGVPTYSFVSGPGVVSGTSVTSSSVGVVRVRVDYPATADFTAGTAFADVTVNPRPVTITLRDQEFDFDGTPKTASYTLSDPAAALAGMIRADVSRGPGVNSYPVLVSAIGNYTGSASATLRILPVIERFSGTPPPPPTAAVSLPPSV